MKCYNHHESDAVGVCKNCNKGLCLNCAVDVGDGLACKNSCEQAVLDVNKIIQASKSVIKKSSGYYYKLAIIDALFALFFIGYPFMVDWSMAAYLIPCGVIFVIAMIFMIHNGMKIKQEDEKT